MPRMKIAEEKLSLLEGLLKNATFAPWVVRVLHTFDFLPYGSALAHENGAQITERVYNTPDAEFIVEMRNNAKEILEDLKQLQTLQSELQKLSTEMLAYANVKRDRGSYLYVECGDLYAAEKYREIVEAVTLFRDKLESVLDGQNH